MRRPFVANKRLSLTSKQQRTAPATPSKAGSGSRRGGGGRSGTTDYRHASSSSSSSASRTVRAVWAGRILFVLCLSTVAAGLGVAAYYFLSGSETALAETQFTSIADRALSEAVKIASQRRWAASTMAAVATEQNPNADDWPFVYVAGFERIVQNLLMASSGKDIGFVPFVTPEQVEAYEAFAYDYYENSRLPEPFPNGTGQSSFGKGIWAINKTNGSPDGRYHDTNATTNYGSPNNIFTPVFHTDEGANPLLMFNVHFNKIRGQSIDNMIACSEERALQEELSPEHSCGVITPIMPIVKFDGQPGAAIFQPMYPAYNQSVIVGFTPTVLLFSEVLENIFADEVSGIDCIIESPGKSLTYSVQNGIAIYQGGGDLHQSKYDKLKQSAVLTDSALYTEESPMYNLTLYPNDDLYVAYSTNNPMVATIGAVAIIFVTSLFFFLYDFSVRREFNAKRELLQAKRQFMRFVSHEVRTPLNSVCMGLTVIMTEIRSSLGDETAHSLENTHIEDLVPVKDAAEGDRNSLEWYTLANEIHNNAQDAVDVLNDLLNYDKVEQGKLHLEITVVDIWQLVERATSEFRLPAAKKRIVYETQFLVPDEEGGEDATTTVDSSKQLPSHIGDLKLIGDSVRIAQVLRNLVSNALKFTPESGTVRVVASWIPPKDSQVGELEQVVLKNDAVVDANRMGFLQILVSDSGAGMSKAELGKLYKDGIQFNVNKLQAGQGTGLGLFIAKGIVEQHHGTLEASSEGLEKGTTFTMVLPLWKVAEVAGDTDEVYATHSGMVLPCAIELTSLRVLVVDDSKSNRKLLCRLLTNAGHKCDKAENGEQAVELVKKAMTENHPYDSVLMDSEMPVLSGPEASTEIRDAGSDVFIIGISGNVLPEDVQHFKLSGANAVLPKPLKIADVDALWMEYGIYSRTPAD